MITVFLIRSYKFWFPRFCIRPFIKTVNILCLFVYLSHYSLLSKAIFYSALSYYPTLRAPNSLWAKHTSRYRKGVIWIQAAFSRQACWELKAACSLLSVAETASQPVHFKQDWWLQWNGNICWVTALKAWLPSSHNTKWLPHVVCFSLTYSRSAFTQARDIKPGVCRCKTQTPTPTGILQTRWRAQTHVFAVCHGGTLRNRVMVIKDKRYLC